MSVQIKPFGTTRDGTPVQLAVLKNEHLEAHIISYAAAIQKLLVPDRAGRPVDVVLGFPDVAGRWARWWAGTPTASAGRGFT